MLPEALAMVNRIKEQLDIAQKKRKKKKQSFARDVLTVELFLHAVKPPPDRASERESF